MPAEERRLRNPETQATAKMKMRPVSEHDFRRPVRARASAHPRVAKLGYGLAEALTTALTAFAASPWRVTFDRIDEAIPGETREVESWFRAESQAGSMTLCLHADKAIISACCEAAFGGSGTEPPFELIDRPVSLIEQGVANAAIAKLHPAVTATLSQLLEAPVSLFHETASNSDRDSGLDTLVFRFLVCLYGYSCELSLMMITSELMAQFANAGLKDAETEKPDMLRENLRRNILGTTAMLTVELTTERVLVEELTALKPGKLLMLSAEISTPVHLLCDGVLIYPATLSRISDRLALRLLPSFD